jgi:hypothetical protein
MSLLFPLMIVFVLSGIFINFISLSKKEVEEEKEEQ